MRKLPRSGCEVMSTTQAPNAYLGRIRLRRLSAALQVGLAMPGVGRSSEPGRDREPLAGGDRADLVTNFWKKSNQQARQEASLQRKTAFLPRRTRGLGHRTSEHHQRQLSLAGESVAAALRKTITETRRFAIPAGEPEETSRCRLKKSPGPYLWKYGPSQPLNEV